MITGREPCRLAAINRSIMATPKSKEADEIREDVLAERKVSPLPDEKEAAVARVRAENKKLGHSIDRVVDALKGKPA
jgi:hypothetical protein